MEYTKPWLSIESQIDQLTSRGVLVDDHERLAHLLRTIGYYRFTGYLYPFKQSENYADDDGRRRTRVLDGYCSGTTTESAAQLIAFDRDLRELVLDGVERIEVALRTQVGYTLGHVSAFAHENTASFVTSFTEAHFDPKTDELRPSTHAEWLARVKDRRDGSDEAFVAHFREKYDDHMPIWALTEVLELGQLSRLYSGLINSLATEIAAAFDVPTKKLMGSWIASINYVRNVSAHHARLFNRKLVTAPKRPGAHQVPLLEHLRSGDAPKDFGVYNTLAVMAYLLRTINPAGEWAQRVRTLLLEFPESDRINLGSMGIAPGWLAHELWGT